MITERRDEGKREGRQGWWQGKKENEKGEAETKINEIKYDSNWKEHCYLDMKAAYY